MAVITIDTLIGKVDNEIIRLEKLNSINVTVRIDDTVDFLKDVLFDTKAIKGDQKFDLVETIGENCTAVYELNGDVITAGSNVLTYGDELTITITADTGYTINAFTINDVSYTLGDVVEETLTVVDNLQVVASAELKTFNLVTTPDANCLITVTKDGEPIVAGTDVLTYGDIITITSTATEGYDLESLEVNGEAFTSGETHTVEDNVTIVATSIAKTYDLTSTPDANCTILVTRNGEEVVAGTDVISYDDVLVITATATEGYEILTLQVNSADFISGEEQEVVGDVVITATSQLI